MGCALGSLGIYDDSMPCVCAFCFYLSLSCFFWGGGPYLGLFKAKPKPNFGIPSFRGTPSLLFVLGLGSNQSSFCLFKERMAGRRWADPMTASMFQ